MVFSSFPFLCFFLPITILAERLMRSTRAKNTILVCASLLFYAYGEPIFIVLMLVSTLLNYAFGHLVAAHLGDIRKAWLACAVVFNIGMLLIFKYAGMLVTTLDAITGLAIPVPAIPLPLGISFYTFQALSYVIDVYREEVKPQLSYGRILLYISLFPQLIAGPIVKYHDVDVEIVHRHAGMNELAVGLRRFSFGLAKKVLIANVMATTADTLFALPEGDLNAPIAWIAALSYLLQIYFDFSGYSDMAIGLGICFGFHFMENFDYPYSARSVKEFWRRWHISLSTWLKEYLYIPLGGNRKGKARTACNRIVVFFICGLWHGANWTFVVWGLLHGMMLLLEETIDRKRLPSLLGHLYTLLFVMMTFVIFRCDTLAQGWLFLVNMFCGWQISTVSTIYLVKHLTPLFLLTIIIGALLSGSLPNRIRNRIFSRTSIAYSGIPFELASYATAFILLLLCVITLSSGTYNPFIYFRF